MLAYSTIAHMGFMLLGLLSGVVGGNWLNAPEAYAAAMFYMMVYVMMSLGAFGMLLYLSRKGFECENLDDLKGLNRRNPWYAFLMLIADVLARRHAADRRLLRQARGALARRSTPARSGWRWSRWCSRWSARSTTCASSS